MVKRLYLLSLMCLFVVIASAQSSSTIVANPADGSTVESLSSVVLTFPDASMVDVGSATNVTITSDKGYSAGCSLEYGDADNQMVVTFTEVTAEAVYTISFPANALTADNIPVEAFSLTYQIGAQVVEGLVLTPAAGTVTWLSDITVTAAAAPTKSLYSNYNAVEKPSLKGPDGKEVIVDGNSVYDSSLGYSVYHFSPRLLITTPGEYTLTIPDDYFYYQDDNWNNVYQPGVTAVFNVTVGQQEVFTSVPSKDTPVSQFQKLTITFPNATTVVGNSSASIVLYQNAETWKGSGSLSYNFTYEGNTMSYSVYSPIIDAGHYTMNFPEGCLLLDDQPNAPFMVEFDIVEPEPLNMVVTPSQDASVEGILNSAVITFPDNENVSYNPGTISLYRLNGSSELTVGSAYGETTTIRQDDGKTFKVNFNGIAVENGTYKIYIPKNTFAAGGRYNAETSLTFSYTAPEPATFTVSPVAGSELDRIQNFTLTFAGDDEVTVNSSLNTNILLYKGIPHKNEYGYLTGGTQLSSVALSAIQKTEGKKGEFTFSFPVPGIEKDDYALIVPPGIFLVGNKTFNATDTIVYQATGNGLDKVVAEPSQPVHSLKNISLTFVNETSVVFQNSWASVTLYMVNPDASYDTYKESINANETTYAGLATIDANQPNKINMELLNEYTEEGEYYISLTSYYLFMSDGVTPNTVNKFTFKVDPSVPTGVEEVKSGIETNQRVYTINGMEVKEMNRPGLYIKGGKKVIKR